MLNVYNFQVSKTKKDLGFMAKGLVFSDTLENATKTVQEYYPHNYVTVDLEHENVCLGTILEY